MHDLVNAILTRNEISTKCTIRQLIAFRHTLVCEQYLSGHTLYNSSGKPAYRETNLEDLYTDASTT